MANLLGFGENTKKYEKVFLKLIDNDKYIVYTSICR